MFALGRVLATPGAIAALRRNRADSAAFLARHLQLDPGLLDAHDQLANLRAVQEGMRILSVYQLADGTRLWLITEADRSATILLLPEEY